MERLQCSSEARTVLVVSEIGLPAADMAVRLRCRPGGLHPSIGPKPDIEPGDAGARGCFDSGGASQRLL
jgi:hypothetical protein